MKSDFRFYGMDRRFWDLLMDDGHRKSPIKTSEIYRGNLKSDFINLTSQINFYSKRKAPFPFAVEKGALFFQ